MVASFKRTLSGLLMYYMVAQRATVSTRRSLSSSTRHPPRWRYRRSDPGTRGRRRRTGWPRRRRFPRCSAGTGRPRRRYLDPTPDADSERGVGSVPAAGRRRCRARARARRLRCCPLPGEPEGGEMPAPGGGLHGQPGLPGRAGRDVAVNGANHVVVGGGWPWARRRNRVAKGHGCRRPSLKKHESRNYACERRCGHSQCLELSGECLGLGMSGCCGHHPPNPEAPRSPGELTPADVRWRGQRLSPGNLLDPGYEVWDNAGIRHCSFNGPKAVALTRSHPTDLRRSAAWCPSRMGQCCG